MKLIDLHNTKAIQKSRRAALLAQERSSYEKSESNSVSPPETAQDFFDLLTVTETLALEKQIEAEGTPLFELMESAGRSVSDYVKEVAQKPCSVTIFCGSGNNGGDGWVVARNLAHEAYSITLVTALEARQLKAEPARSAALETLAHNYPTLRICTAPTKEQLVSLLQNTDFVVDALLGIGFSGDMVKEPYRTWIDAINREKRRRTQAQLHIVAVDVPSGLCADTGNAATPCIEADATITMLACKPGLLSDPSYKHCGHVYLAQLLDR